MMLSRVLELVQRFDRNLDADKSADYQEAHVRAEFIDSFFEALGWDVRNVQGTLSHRTPEATDRQIDALVYE